MRCGGRVAEEDWARDSKGNPEMEKEDFMDAIFELADLWTSSLEATEYSQFLMWLLGILSDGTTFRDDADISADTFQRLMGSASKDPMSVSKDQRRRSRRGGSEDASRISSAKASRRHSFLSFSSSTFR